MDQEEKNNIFKIAFACAIGAGFGTLIALSVTFKYFWVGPLAGGALGYLAVNFRRVIAAVPVAWKAATSFKLDKKRFMIYLAAVATIYLWIFILTFGLFLGFSVLPPTNKIPGILGIIGIATLYIGFLILGTGLPSKMERYDRCRDVTMKCSPLIVLPFAIPVALFYIFIYLGEAIGFVGTVFRAIGRFFWTFFKLIHSDIRYICGIDSLFGATVGFLAGMKYVGPLILFVGIGSLAGAAFGVLNYVIVRNVLLRKYFVEAA